MSARAADLRERGAALVFVGNGPVRYAKAFAEEQHLGDVALLTDPELSAYHALHLEHGVLKTLGLGAAVRSVKAFRAGFRQSKTVGDPWQQGGAIVVTPDGRVPYFFASGGPGDHPSPEDVIAALPPGHTASG